ncbi:bifunctional alpha,alpha-trehalose-phosphate synthase (UDP-forming)/trehalose-phosphatase [Phaeodactylibacter luteus]|uniref:Alpha,alpha-trehalose-phosphate synthase n=1 Tax=Phaeodactylibacter luteus TaxID=1564516 RepID=A0A5C6S3G8_9BACT|nr:bifunctional alpha,alpha-trehalose-phosphate synthase (UDP-forming)/trehalose-phosphatase [Phaeodactylibacter luteus]TXB68962.1 bifunctional alpha,alpha-trehalose-phosphate synthase (UDP-forming)/trehalose-phosphatase [Phaeodactylibacter luteus]
MSRLVIISNRLPVTIKKEAGDLIYHPSAGGLATGLNSLDESFEKIWIGWPGQEINDEWERATVQEDLKKDGLYPVFLSQQDIALYYEGFSNKTIWPHFHYFTQYTSYNDDNWEAYQAVNRKFAEAVIPLIQEGDMVWVHDYQLMLLPAMIREAFPEVSIGFFLHIPFPSYEVFRVLPWRRQLLEGVLGADQIGFHTFGYMRHFLSAVYRICGFEHHFGMLTVGNRLVNVDVFPMGIDYEKYAHPEGEKQLSEASQKIVALSQQQKLIISIDRLDYSKGIPQRLRAFASFLQGHPEYHGKVSLVMIVVPSRANVPQYKALKHKIDNLVGRINGEFSGFDWAPVQYFYRSLNFGDLTTLYKAAHIALITPLRDGMNLVAKEFIASKEDSKQGVIILSEMAGASNELTEAISVNPQDRQDITDALIQALNMPPEEQRARLESMQEKLRKYDVKNWAANFIKEQKKLMESQRAKIAKRMNNSIRKDLVGKYRAASHRLVILDYDGTLMPFHKDPQAVVPDEEVMGLLKLLSGHEGTKLIVNSGRDRNTLESWLGGLGLDMAAEHGVWMKRDGTWKSNPGLSVSWKPKIRQVLENMVERTPGSFIEEKDFSIAWHYRQIDPELGEKRVREFRDVLLYLTANDDLQVLEGNKVVEIKNAGVNKGKATLNWLGEQPWDFIMAIGDDHTDEDTFKALPEDANTVKVGLDKSVARFNLLSVEDVRKFLKEFTVG